MWPQHITAGGSSMSETVALEPIQANEIDADLERSLTHEWDAQIITYPNERFSFNEWIRVRIRLMGYPVGGSQLLPRGRS